MLLSMSDYRVVLSFRRGGLGISLTRSYRHFAYLAITSCFLNLASSSSMVPAKKAMAAWPFRYMGRREAVCSVVFR